MNVSQSPLRPFDYQAFQASWRERRRVNRMIWRLAAGTVVALGFAVGSLIGWMS